MPEPYNPHYPNLKLPKFTPDGFVDKEAFNTAMELLDNLLAGYTPGGSGKITVISGPTGSPEERIVTDVTKVRFLTEYLPGEHHICFPGGLDEVWIGLSPPPATLQGVDLTPYPAKVTGGLSTSGTSTYNPADPAGSIISYITRTESWSAGTPAAVFGWSSNGLLILSRNGIDILTLDLTANFVELNRGVGQNMADYNTAGRGDLPLNGIVSIAGLQLRLVSCAPTSADTDAYQKGSALLVLSGGLLEGWNDFQLRHEIDGSGPIYTANSWECYQDKDPAGVGNDPAVTLLDMDLNTLTAKWLSGVQYCGLGTTFDQDMTAVRCANNVYHSSSLCVTLDSFPGLSLNRPTFAECGVAPFPAIGDTLQFVDRLVTLDTASAYSEDARLRGTPRDPYGSYTAFWSPSADILVNTYGNVSTSFWEPCQDENWRLPAGAYNTPPVSWTGNWDSTGDLNTYDDTTGIQYRSGGAYYPEYNYTAGYVPSIGQPDYTTIWGANNPRWLWRGFRDNGVSHSNGTIRLPGITDAMLAASSILVWIKAPTRTGWLRLHGTLYNPIGWTGVDNDPCRTTGGSGNDHNFTLATLGTNPASDWGIVVRIQIPNRTSPEITGAWGMTAW